LERALKEATKITTPTQTQIGKLIPMFRFIYKIHIKYHKNPNLNYNKKLTKLKCEMKPYQKLRHWDGNRRNKLMMKFGNGSDALLFELLG